MVVLTVILSIMLFTGLLIAILFEQYTVALVLLGITLILATFIAVKMRVEKKEVLPVHKITILGYPLKEISSTEVQRGGEFEGETKGKYGKLRGGKKEEFKTEFDI